MRFLAIFFLQPFYRFFTDGTYRRLVWLALTIGWRKRYRPASARFAGYRVRVPDALSFLYQYLDIFHKQIYRFPTPKAGEKSVILDCGANVGTSALFFAKNYPAAEIHAFEPDPKIFAYLRENIENNRVANVQLHQKAIWIEEGELHFQQEGADAGSLLAEDNSSTKAVSSIAVACTPLRDWLQQYEEVDLLKIDIEGAELDVILHCADSLRRCRRIFIEYHAFLGKEQRLDELLATLRRAGFRISLESVLHRPMPFMPLARKGDMDIQLNVFALREASDE